MQHPRVKISGGIVGVAFVSREKDLKLNAKAYAEAAARRQTGCCLGWCFCELKRAVYDAYTSSREYIHCEIVFPTDGDRTKCVAYPVFSDGESSGVTKQMRTFSNPSYDMIYLTVNPTELKKIVNFCDEHVGDKFDYVATGWRFVVCPPEATRETWWCASFVHAALQEINILTDHRLNTLDVDDIRGELESNPRKISFGGAPPDRKALENTIQTTFFGKKSMPRDHAAPPRR